MRGNTMGNMLGEKRVVLLSAFSKILSTFYCIKSIHGFIYYILILGGYIFARYAELKPGTTEYITSTSIIRKQAQTNDELMARLQLLRNAFAHWNTDKIAENLNIVSEKLPNADISVLDETLTMAVKVLQEVDYDMIKKELMKISPEINF